MATSTRPTFRLPSLSLPPLDALTIGAGVVLGAVLVVAPAAAAVLDVAPWIAIPDSAEIAGIPAAPIVVIIGGLLALVGLEDLAGRSELRQGGAILALGAGALAGLALALTVRDMLGSDLVVREEALALAPALVSIVWGCALAVGTIGFGPTRTAVLIGLVTLAIALLLPTAPDGKPFLDTVLTGGPMYLAIIAGMLLAAVWRLLDLPFVGGIILGIGLFVVVLYQGAVVGIDESSTTIPLGMLAETIPILLLYAAAIWIALGATFGRPTPEL
jgi:hypothetical protein